MLHVGHEMDLTLELRHVLTFSGGAEVGTTRVIVQKETNLGKETRTNS